MRESRVSGSVESELGLQTQYQLIEALSSSEQRYRTLVEQLQEVVFQADENFCFTFLNRAWEVVSGTAVADAIGRPIIEFIDDASHQDWLGVCKSCQENIAEAGLQELCLRHPSEGVRWMTVHIKRVGSKQEWVGSMHDISERKHTEKLQLERDRAEAANQAKTEFLAKMSHELRTPLHAVLSFAGIGGNKCDSAPREKLASYFSRISDSGSRLLMLLNDLLDLSKLESARMHFDKGHHDLAVVVDRSVDALHGLLSEKALTVEVEPSDVDKTAYFDADRLLQVLYNLLGNAIKFTPDGHAITIRFAEATIPAGRRSTDTKRIPALSLSVSDQGIGIPENELESVFEKFVQSSKTRTNADGTGLGLAICREIIEGHGGTIEARNNPDRGSVFTLTIPRKPIDLGRESRSR